MNIVHYIIGTPDFRHGGAAQYACDLALSQSKENKVSLLFPGNISITNPKVTISRTGIWKGLNCYRINNPVVSPLLFGIRNSRYIFSSAHIPDSKSIERFLAKEHPDILHIHTLMGLSPQIVHIIKDKGVKVVYTSHDYFGICPKANLIDSNGKECICSDGTFCKSCNSESASLLKLLILNSSLFLHSKQFLRKIGILPRRHFSVNCSHKELVKEEHSGFIDLNLFYKEIFDLIDVIHFNSYVSENEFRSQGINIPGAVIPITAGSISDNRILWNDIEKSNINISYIGGLSIVKGFPVLKKVLIALYNEGLTNWTLNVWEGDKNYEDSECRNIHYRGRYTRDMIPEVFGSTQLLVVPSLWKETFGLSVIEGLQYGVPVLASSRVGAKMILEKISTDFIFTNDESMKNILKDILLHPEKLVKYNNKICEADSINFSIDKHTEEINSLYKKIRNGE